MAGGECAVCGYRYGAADRERGRGARPWSLSLKSREGADLLHLGQVRDLLASLLAHTLLALHLALVWRREVWELARQIDGALGTQPCGGGRRTRHSQTTSHATTEAAATSAIQTASEAATIAQAAANAAARATAQAATEAAATRATTRATTTEATEATAAQAIAPQATAWPTNRCPIAEQPATCRAHGRRHRWRRARDKVGHAAKGMRGARGA